MLIKPKDIDGMAAMMTAEREDMCKREGERDTEFVKRIVATYLRCYSLLRQEAVVELRMVHAKQLLEFLGAKKLLRSGA